MWLKLEVYSDQMFTREIKVKWRGGVRPAECRASSWWWCDWCKSKCQSPPRWTGSFQTSDHTNKQAQRTGRSLADYLCPGRIIKKKMLLKCITVKQVFQRSRFIAPPAAQKFVHVYYPDLQMIIRNLSSSRARFCCSGSRPSEAFWTHCSSWWRKTCRMLSGRSVNTGGSSSGLETHKEGGKMLKMPDGVG